MPKIAPAGATVKISLEKIRADSNIRERYEGIEELAASIRRDGQLQPVLVQPDGEEYILISGHRRYRAFQMLCERGENFSQIDARAVPGDMLTLQLVENIQREDLTAAERERGFWLMQKAGMKQSEIAERLSKPKEYVSRQISAYRVRKALEEDFSLDASELSTGTLNELQALAKEKSSQPLLAAYYAIMREGGTQQAARKYMEKWREAKEKEKMAREAEEVLAAAEEDARAGREAEERERRLAQENAYENRRVVEPDAADIEFDMDAQGEDVPPDVGEAEGEKPSADSDREIRLSLQPCPFCAAQYEHLAILNGCVRCGNCGATGPLADDPDDTERIVEAWNIRPFE
jgi:ParB/RepB/Spo0J family partition protein